MFEVLEVYKITWYSNVFMIIRIKNRVLEVYKITWYSNDEFNEDMDKYFDIATKDEVIVEIEENKSVVIMPEKEYKELKDN